jgi:ankyrin repeat protein
MNLSLIDFMNNPVAPKRPYEIPETQEFFVAVKMSEYSGVRHYLEQNRYFAYQVDCVGKTALHKACEKDCLYTVQLLVTFHSDVNKRDSLGNTPLTYAFARDNIKIVRYLLANRAKPWFDKSGSYERFVAGKWKLKTLLEIARGFSLRGVFESVKAKELMWKNDAYDWFFVLHKF